MITEVAHEQEAGAAVAPPPPKTAPEKLILRADPRRIVRFRRGVIIGGATVGSLAVAGIAWMTLSRHPLPVAAFGEEQVITGRKTPADVVANLPGDYGKVPALGPPLPGDLGKPILDRQRQLDAGGGVSPSPETMSPVEQAAELERQRRAAQADQARQSGVLVQLSVDPTATSEGATIAAAAPVNTAAAERSGKLALDPEHDQNNQQRKLDFVSRGATSGIYDGHGLQTPASPYEVIAGTVISASLITGLNSGLPGLAVAQVTENVFDTVTGRILLIPQGSRLIGQYDSVVAFGQERALLVWQRIILPDGSSMQIDNLPATDTAGYTGLEDQVDVHTWQLLKGVALSTLLGIGTQISIGNDQSDLVRAIAESGQQSTSRAGQQIVSRELNVQPTIRVRPGWPLRIVVHKDLVLEEWTGR